MESTRSRRLGELLLERGLIDQRQLRQGLAAQSSTRERLGSTLVRLGFLSEVSLAVQLSKLTSFPCVNVDGTRIPEEILGAIPARVARERKMLPLWISHGALHVAVADPGEEEALRWARAASGMDVVPMVAPEFKLKQAIEGYYGAVE